MLFTSYRVPPHLKFNVHEVHFAWTYLSIRSNFIVLSHLHRWNVQYTYRRRATNISYNHSFYSLVAFISSLLWNISCASKKANGMFYFPLCCCWSYIQHYSWFAFCYTISQNKGIHFIYFSPLWRVQCFVLLFFGNICCCCTKSCTKLTPINKTFTRLQAFFWQIEFNSDGFSDDSIKHALNS